MTDDGYCFTVYPDMHGLALVQISVQEWHHPGTLNPHRT
jgi:hypothetical protein